MPSEKERSKKGEQAKTGAERGRIASHLHQAHLESTKVIDKPLSRLAEKEQ
jgi:hypothetical protein